MSVNRVQKEALIAATILFDSESDDTPVKINSSLVNNFIDVVSLDGLAGAPAIPLAGTYEIYAKTDEDSGFKTVASLDATKTGGSALADGVQVGTTFTGLPLVIKIVPTGVSVALAYKVLIKQVSV